MRSLKVKIFLTRLEVLLYHRVFYFCIILFWKKCHHHFQLQVEVLSVFISFVPTLKKYITRSCYLWKNSEKFATCQCDSGELWPYKSLKSWIKSWSFTILSFHFLTYSSESIHQSTISTVVKTSFCWESIHYINSSETIKITEH